MAPFGSAPTHPSVYASQASGSHDWSAASHSHSHSTTRRIVQMQDWAPAQEAMFPDASAAIPIRPPSQGQFHTALPPPSRLRSMSVSLPWRQRPKSAFLEPNTESGYHGLFLEKSESQGSGGDEGDAHLAPTTPKHHGNFKRMLRRASISLKEGVKGFVQRRTSVPATTTFDSDGQPARPLFAGASHHAPRPSTPRPTTSHMAWSRLRQATSFRHSRMLYPGHGERMFEHDLGPIESPTLPVPGSGEQPPIIPRKTGAAARQAAAIACHGLHGYDLMENHFPRPGWLAEDALDDHESGIGIALTSSEMEAYVPGDEVDSDVDVDADLTRDETAIIKVDFISRLPMELAIQVLALLDAPTLNTASRVSSGWHSVVKNQHIWRESFLREKTTTYATSGPVRPGVGLGVPRVQPENNWKEIYRVKTELDKRWKEGKAQPVYLNGHTDSIYCLQFDECVFFLGPQQTPSH